MNGWSSFCWLLYWLSIAIGFVCWILQSTFLFYYLSNWRFVSNSNEPACQNIFKLPQGTCSFIQVIRYNFYKTFQFAWCQFPQVFLIFEWNSLRIYVLKYTISYVKFFCGHHISLISFHILRMWDSWFMTSFWCKRLQR